MDKRADRKSHRITGNKKNTIGMTIGIHDKNGDELKVGDNVKCGEYNGIILWDNENNKYMFCILYSKWYGDNIYDANSYGKSLELHMDDGARMEMELIND